MASESPGTFLVQTVGGSPDPLRTALGATRPDEALFITSESGLETTSSTSEVEAELKGCEGFPGRYRILEVPADDPDKALARILPQLESALARYPQVIADFTGGTKSMSGALVLAAFLLGRVRLQLMAGQRRDLDKVVAGTERPYSVDADAMAFGRILGLVQDLVRTHAYGAALAALPASPPPGLPKALRQRHDLWRRWLAILDRWDRMDHAGAMKMVPANGPLRQALEAAGLLARLERLAGAKGRPSADLCEDLWWNAQRRAAQGAYDDAVARLYRLYEASVQLQLWRRHDILTGKVPIARLPEGFLAGRAETPADGCVSLALSESLRLLRALSPDCELPFEEDGRPPAWQGQRNRSILAHGFGPLGEKEWAAAERWFAARLGQLWRDLYPGSEAVQLPDALPET